MLVITYTSSLFSTAVTCKILSRFATNVIFSTAVKFVICTVVRPLLNDISADVNCTTDPTMNGEVPASSILSILTE